MVAHWPAGGRLLAETRKECAHLHAYHRAAVQAAKNSQPRLVQLRGTSLESLLAGLQGRP